MRTNDRYVFSEPHVGTGLPIGDGVDRIFTTVVQTFAIGLS